MRSALTNIPKNPEYPFSYEYNPLLYKGRIAYRDLYFLDEVLEGMVLYKQNFRGFCVRKRPQRLLTLRPFFVRFF